MMTLVSSLTRLPLQAQVEAVMNQTALEQLSCVQNNRVFDITLSGVNAWFEAQSVEPHVSTNAFVPGMTCRA